MGRFLSQSLSQRETLSRRSKPEVERGERNEQSDPAAEQKPEPLPKVLSASDRLFRFLQRLNNQRLIEEFRDTVLRNGDTARYREREGDGEDFAHAEKILRHRRELWNLVWESSVASLGRLSSPDKERQKEKCVNEEKRVPTLLMGKKRERKSSDEEAFEDGEKKKKREERKKRRFSPALSFPRSRGSFFYEASPALALSSHVLAHSLLQEEEKQENLSKSTKCLSLLPSSPVDNRDKKHRRKEEKAEASWSSSQSSAVSLPVPVAPELPNREKREALSETERRLASMGSQASPAAGHSLDPALSAPAGSVALMSESADEGESIQEDEKRKEQERQKVSNTLLLALQEHVSSLMKSCAEKLEASFLKERDDLSRERDDWRKEREVWTKEKETWQEVRQKDRQEERRQGETEEDPVTETGEPKKMNNAAQNDSSRDNNEKMKKRQPSVLSSSSSSLCLSSLPKEPLRLLQSSFEILKGETIVQIEEMKRLSNDWDVKFKRFAEAHSKIIAQQSITLEESCQESQTAFSLRVEKQLQEEKQERERDFREQVDKLRKVFEKEREEELLRKEPLSIIECPLSEEELEKKLIPLRQLVEEGFLASRETLQRAQERERDLLDASAEINELLLGILSSDSQRQREEVRERENRRHSLLLFLHRLTEKGQGEERERSYSDPKVIPEESFSPKAPPAFTAEDTSRRERSRRGKREPSGKESEKTIIGQGGVKKRREPKVDLEEERRRKMDGLKLELKEKAAERRALAKELSGARKEEETVLLDILGTLNKQLQRVQDQERETAGNVEKIQEALHLAEEEREVKEKEEERTLKEKEERQADAFLEMARQYTVTALENYVPSSLLQSEIDSLRTTLMEGVTASLEGCEKRLKAEIEEKSLFLIQSHSSSSKIEAELSVMKAHFQTTTKQVDELKEQLGVLAESLRVADEERKRSGKSRERAQAALFTKKIAEASSMALALGDKLTKKMNEVKELGERERIEWTQTWEKEERQKRKSWENKTSQELKKLRERERDARAAIETEQQKLRRELDKIERRLACFSPPPSCRHQLVPVSTTERAAGSSDLASSIPPELSAADGPSTAEVLQIGRKDREKGKRILSHIRQLICEAQEQFKREMTHDTEQLISKQVAEVAQRLCLALEEKWSAMASDLQDLVRRSQEEAAEKMKREVEQMMRATSGENQLCRGRSPGRLVAEGDEAAPHDQLEPNPVTGGFSTSVTVQLKSLEEELEKQNLSSGVLGQALKSLVAAMRRQEELDHEMEDTDNINGPGATSAACAVNAIKKLLEENRGAAADMACDRVRKLIKQVSAVNARHFEELSCRLKLELERELEFRLDSARAYDRSICIEIVLARMVEKFDSWASVLLLSQITPPNAQHFPPAAVMGPLSSPPPLQPTSVGALTSDIVGWQQDQLQRNVLGCALVGPSASLSLAASATSPPPSGGSIMATSCCPSSSSPIVEGVSLEGQRRPTSAGRASAPSADPHAAVSSMRTSS